MCDHIIRSVKNKTGATLIELMLAVTLSLLIVSLIFEIYLASQRSSHLQSVLNRIEDHAKTAINILKADIQQVGYVGCPQLTEDFPISSVLNQAITPKNLLTGSMHDIIVRRAEYTGVVVDHLDQTRTIIYSTKEEKFSVGDYLVIADCFHVDIALVSAVGNSGQLQKLTVTQPLSEYDAVGAEIGRLTMNHYSISPSHSLSVEDIDGKETELVQGVDEMMIHYFIYQESKLVETNAPESGATIPIAAVAIDLRVADSEIKKMWYVFIPINTIGK